MISKKDKLQLISEHYKKDYEWIKKKIRERAITEKRTQKDIVDSVYRDTKRSIQFKVAKAL